MKKRGLPEGYVRGIEKLWGLSIRQIENIEADVVSTLNKSTTGELWNDTSGSTETLQETWRNSRISKELERLLPLLEIEDKTGKRKRDGARGESFSEARPSKATPKAVDELQTAPSVLTPDKPATWQTPPQQNQNLGDLEHGPPVLSSNIQASNDAGNLPSQSSSTTFQQDRGPLKLPDRTFRLIDVYFSYTHSWLPILEKYDIMRFSHQYSASRANLGDKSSNSANHAVIWAILAYADHQLQVFSEAQVPSPLTMYDYARGLIPNEAGSYEIGHVQALLILTLYNMGVGSWNKAWHLIGQAGRIAIDLGLDKLDSPSSKRSQHVFSGCFVLDTIVAARTKRKPQLRRSDLGLSSNRIEEDGLEEWDPFNDALGVSTAEISRGPATILSTFNQLIRIVAVLNDTICASSNTVDFLPHQSILQELKSLQHQLPPQFRPMWEARSGEPAPSDPILPHQYHLHMSYISTVANLYISAQVAGYHLDRSAESVAASTIRQVAKLLKHHSQHFGLLIMPPTYDFHTLVAGQCAYIDQNPLDDYRLDIQHSLSTMVKTWPTYSSVDNFFITGELGPVSVVPEQPKITPGRQSFSSARPQIMQRPASHSKESLSETFAPTRATTSNTQYGFPLVDLSMSNIQQISPTNHFVPSTPGGQSWTGATPARDGFVGSNVPLPPPSVFEGSANIDIDGDSMFNEFATLDAMEWTNNWDQSLVNLGFTDPSSMNQDFYALSREPDPLYPNDLVQQLLSNSNMNVNNNMGDNGGNMTGGATVGGTGRAFEMNDAMMNYPNPHVEASQILQALATAQERSGQSRGK